MVVHAEEGLDEIGLGSRTHVAELHHGKVRSYTVAPEEFGFKRVPASALVVDDVTGSLATMRDVLDDTPGPARDVVALNAGAAIYTAGLAESLEQGVQRALEAIASGAAREKLDELVRVTQSF